MTEEILFSKYRTVEVLKSSSKGRVLKVENLKLHSERIIKEILKDAEGIESIQSEISILKELNFLGIPQIYDVEETEKYYYVMEEFVRGETLDALVSREGQLPALQVLFLGKQLVQILKTLHSYPSGAVLHLDIQPKNIMIAQSQVFLIDFGNAIFLKDAGMRVVLKGTPGFAAPEQYSGEIPGFDTDVYGVGACIAFMLTGKRGRESLAGVEERFLPLLSDCMREKRSERIADMDTLLQRLELLEQSFYEKKEEQVDRRDDYPVQIVFAGSQSRIGTSYLALGFTKYLRLKGVTAIYKEENESGMVSDLVRYEKDIPYREGAFFYESVPMYPMSEHASWGLDYADVIVRDAGVFDEDVSYEEPMVIVAGEKAWERKYVNRVREGLTKKGMGQKTLFLWNISGEDVEKHAVRRQDGGYRMPFLKSIAEVEEYAVFEAVFKQMKLWKGEGNVSENKGLFGKQKQSGRWKYV